VFGLARHVIQFFIFIASNDGHQERMSPPNSGGVQAATYLKKILYRHTYVGAGKRLTLSLSLAFLPTLAIRPVVNLEPQGNAHTHVNYFAMQAHVHLASIWDPRKPAFAARSP
jgi:hypothetical protein